MSKKVAPKGAKEEEGVQAPVFEPTTFIALESSDGDRLFLDRNCAKLSRLIKQVLQDAAAADHVICTVSSMSFPIAPELLAKQPAAATTSPDIGAPLDPHGAIDASAAAASHVLTYPLVKLPALNTEQLNHAVAYMHYKYRYDSEADKKTSVVFAESGGAVPKGVDGLRWAAIAHVLQL